MPLVKPTIGQTSWGDELNTALDYLDEQGQDAASAAAAAQNTADDAATAEALLETDGTVERIRTLTRARGLGGYRATSRKCPTTKCQVSYTNNSFDGYDGTGPTFKAQDMTNVFDCNWSAQSLVQDPTYLWYYNLSGPWATGWNPGTTQTPGMFVKSLDFTFMVEGSYVSVGHSWYNVGLVGAIRIWIDDEEIEDWKLGTWAAGVAQGTSIINPGLTADGTHVINLNFPTRGIYKVRVSGLYNTVGGVSTSLQGNLITANANTRVLASQKRRRVGVISDSFFEGVYQNTSQTMAQALETELGATVYNFAQGGSGFINPSTGGSEGDKSYGSDLVFAALARMSKVDAMIVHGSCNDLGYTEAAVLSAMTDTFDRLRDEYDERLPIVWVGLEPQSYFKNIYSLASMKARENAQAAVAAAHPNVVAVLKPCNEEWLTGTGSTSAPAGNGNQDFAIGPDGIHLSTYGTRFYGRMIAEQMKNALVAL